VALNRVSKFPESGSSPSEKYLVYKLNYFAIYENLQREFLHA